MLIEQQQHNNNLPLLMNVKSVSDKEPLKEKERKKKKKEKERSVSD